MSGAIVVVDLGFGDAGKGSVVDYLVRKHDAVAVVRYNGGPQAAHRVVLADGREHVFSQFGSGTFVDGVETFLSEFMLVNPLNLYLEERHLQQVGVTDALERLFVDQTCLVITPFHTAANRLRELARGNARHGSCGEGIGEARKDFLAGKALFVRDLYDKALGRRLLELQEAKRSELTEVFAILDREGIESPDREILTDEERLFGFLDAYRAFVDDVNIVDHTHLADLHENGTVVYEGAQGVLLDQDFGFHPYTTWTQTTTKNAEVLLARVRPEKRTVLGVLRAYATRHGPGPFPTEDESLELPDAENGLNRWQGAWRVGHFDPLLARYALRAIDGVNGLVLTCVDRVAEQWRLCDSYIYTGTLPDLWPYFQVDGISGLITNIKPPVTGPTHAHLEALATRLLHCEPHYMTFARDDLIPIIEGHLGFPVVLTSSGETADDKEERRPPLSRLPKVTRA